jgi:hypothetical protein
VTVTVDHRDQHDDYQLERTVRCLERNRRFYTQLALATRDHHVLQRVEQKIADIQVLLHPLHQEYLQRK